MIEVLDPAMDMGRHWSVAKLGLSEDNETFGVYRQSQTRLGCRSGLMVLVLMPFTLCFPLGCLPDLRCDCTVFGHVVQLIDGRVAIAAFVDTFANIAGDAGSRRDFDAGP